MKFSKINEDHKEVKSSNFQKFKKMLENLIKKGIDFSSKIKILEEKILIIF